MSFCPDCHYEYRPGVKTCPECKVDLVEALEELPKESIEDYVEIYMVSTKTEADLIQGLFEENEIKFLVRDLRSFPVLPDFGRRIRLRIAVPATEEQKARKLLEEARVDEALSGQGAFL